jgi:hypothetical protein
MTWTCGGVTGVVVPRLGGGSGIDSGALGVRSSCCCVALRAQERVRGARQRCSAWRASRGSSRLATHPVARSMHPRAAASTLGLSEQTAPARSRCDLARVSHEVREACSRKRDLAPAAERPEAQPRSRPVQPQPTTARAPQGAWQRVRSAGRGTHWQCAAPNRAAQLLCAARVGGCAAAGAARRAHLVVSACRAGRTGARIDQKVLFDGATVRQEPPAALIFYPCPHLMSYDINHQRAPQHANALPQL